MKVLNINRGLVKNRSRIIVQCFPYLADLLQQEIEGLGYIPERVERTAVWLQGTYKDAMRLNYALRTANRVLFLLEEFLAEDPEQLYRQALRMPWESIIPSDGYFSVHGFIRNEHIRDERFAFLRMKDAIADRILDKKGNRPDAGPDRSRCSLYIHWMEHLAAIYIDTSGESISRHGYRKNPFKAPMMEALAAAVIMETSWQPGQVFINPMCGSGTLAIEAALMAKGIYPGNFRTDYSFMHFLHYRSRDWEEVKAEFNRPDKEIGQVIIATDHDREAIKAAEDNARSAGVEDMIRFECVDFRKTSVPPGEGIIILNPEYGERLGVTKALEEVYTGIGDFLKQIGAGKKGYIFTGNSQLAKQVGLRPSRKVPFLNAKIECRLLEYELYKGSKKSK